MCVECQEFFKTKQEWLTHNNICKNNNKQNMSIEEMINEQVKYTHIDPPIPIEKMRLMVTILLKKISTEKRLKELGYEKRLIDNVLVDSLRCAKRSICTDDSLSEADRLKSNISEFLEWTIPEDIMAKFKEERKSVEEILEKLVGSNI
jgi:KRAB domain-containing zinc finger protein